MSMLLSDDPRAMSHGRAKFWSGFAYGWLIATAFTSGLIWVIFR